MAMRPADAVVVGAGPAGALVAMLLARAGVGVVLLDAAEPGRDKPCGEGLMPRGVAAIARAGLGDLVAGSPPLFGVALRLGGRRVAGRFGALPGRGLRRQRFDAALVEAAARAGAEVRFEARVRAVGPSDRGVRWLRLDRRGGAAALLARAVVIADGGRSSLSRDRLEAGLPRRARLGVVAHVERDALEPRAARGTTAAQALLPDENVVEAHLEPSWQVVLTPVEGGAVSVAALVEPPPAPGAAVDALRGDRVAAWLHGRLCAAGFHVPRVAALGAARALPLVAPSSTLPLVEEGLIRVGDAAGAVDPVVGEPERAAVLLAAALDGPGATASALAPYLGFCRKARRFPGAAARLALFLARRPLAARAAASLGACAPTLVDAIIGAVGDA
jgi:flavin-dependent dehydrogenase